MATTPASRKARGRLLQQWVRALLLELADHLEPDDISSRSMGAGGEDVMFSPAARRVYPVSIECKNVERINVWDAYQQAAANAGEWTPVLVIKKNRKAPLAVVDARTFFTLLRETT